MKQLGLISLTAIGLMTSACTSKVQFDQNSAGILSQDVTPPIQTVVDPTPVIVVPTPTPPPAVVTPTPTPVIIPPTTTTTIAPPPPVVVIPTPTPTLPPVIIPPTTTTTIVPPPPPPVVSKATQSFTQAPLNGRVDILFVLDNALSTVEHQQEVANRFGAFTETLSGLDWQIAMTTTDVSNGVYGVQGSLVPIVGGAKNQKIIRPTDANPQGLFAKTVVRQETLDCGFSPTNPCASPWVQPLNATIRAIDKRNSDNAGFFRAGADLAVVIISNKDEMRDGKSFNPTKPDDLIAHFQKTWPTGKKLGGFGLVIKPGDGKCMAEMRKKWKTDPAYGTFASELAEKTGGVLASVCDPNYTSALEQLAGGVGQLPKVFELADEPIAGTVQVKLSNPSQTISWVVEGKNVIFEKAPRAGTVIEITYDKK